MNLQKPWYASRTIWGSLIAIFAAVVSSFGMEIDNQTQTALIDSILQIVAVCGSLFAILGRLNATSTIE